MFFIFLFTVPAFATFDISIDMTHINFGAVNPGEITGDIPPQGLNVTCTSDQGNQWFLRVYTESPLAHIDNPGMDIPDTEFYWYGINTTGQGDLVTEEEDFTSEKIIYTSTAAEGADGVTISVKFKLECPGYVQSGEYDTSIIFTLTE